METLDGIIAEQDEDDIIKIMNGRLTADEYMKASQLKRDEDDHKGDYEFTEENKVQLEEDLWCILNEKLEGTEARGKLTGLMDGDGGPLTHSHLTGAVSILRTTPAHGRC